MTTRMEQSTPDYVPGHGLLRPGQVHAQHGLGGL